jgi:4-amino-4-deoxy-L-arabinose transferase-like glycosyltransferase
MTQVQRAAHYAVVAAVLTASYSTGIGRVPFAKDESQWIATSYYLEALLGEPVDEIRSDVPRPLWGESYETLTQPPLVRYVIGVGRRLGGFGVADLNGKWNFHADAQSNENAGNMPNEKLLLWSRQPMAFLSILSGLLLFSVTWRCAGLLAGYVFALGFAFNPYLLMTLRRAMGEATLTFLVALALVATDYAARRSWMVEPRRTTSRSGLRPSSWWLAAGVFGGLAGAAKLNGIFVVGGVVLVAWIAARCAAGEPRASLRGAIGLLGVVLAAASVGFVAPNPYLHPGSRPGPVSRTIQMWKQRVGEMKVQRTRRADARLDGVTDRARAAARRVFSEHAILQLPGSWVVHGGFTFWGFLLLAWRAFRSVRERQPGTELVVLALGGSLVVPAILSPLDWDRYYLFPVLFGGLCFAVGVSAAVDLARRRLRPSPGADESGAAQPA